MLSRSGAEIDDDIAFSEVIHLQRIDAVQEHLTATSIWPAEEHSAVLSLHHKAIEDGVMQRKFFGHRSRLTADLSVGYGVVLRISAFCGDEAETARQVSGSRLGPAHDREWVVRRMAAFATRKWLTTPIGRSSECSLYLDYPVSSITLSM